MELEIILLKEISQTQEDKYHILNLDQNLYIYHERTGTIGGEKWDRSGEKGNKGG